MDVLQWISIQECAKQAHNGLQIMIARISIGLGTISVVKNKIK